MSLEEVVRQSPPSVGSPDIEVFRNNFMLRYLVTEIVHLAEYCNFVSGGGGTIMAYSS